MGTLSDPVPTTGLAANFSPIPRIAPPPLGRLREGGGVAFGDDSSGCDELAFPDRPLGAEFAFDDSSLGCMTFITAGSPHYSRVSEFLLPVPEDPAPRWLLRDCHAITATCSGAGSPAWCIGEVVSAVMDPITLSANGFCQGLLVRVARHARRQGRVLVEDQSARKCRRPARAPRARRRPRRPSGGVPAGLCKRHEVDRRARERP